MKWEMEMEEIQTVLEKIWDLHDKLSDAIHSVSRAHFLSSVKPLRNSGHRKSAVSDDERVSGYVYVKDFRLDSGDDDDCAIQEAKSLNAIRSALESLEDHLEIFRTVQVQQQAGRDAAVARLEQSRMVLAMRLAEHQGKKYKVIEEALAFVGDVKEANRFSSPEKVYADSPFASSHGTTPTHERKKSNVVFDVLFSGFSFAKKTLKLDFLGGVLGNAAMVAITMVALLHLQQAANSDHQKRLEGAAFPNRRVRKPSSIQESSSEDRSSGLDVLLARG